jgi:hypothetical protein
MVGGAQELPATALPGLVGTRALAGRFLPGSCFANENKRADCRRRDRLTMPGERRLYKTGKGKAVAHRLWRCSHPPGAGLPLGLGREKPTTQRPP